MWHTRRRRRYNNSGSSEDLSDSYDELNVTTVDVANETQEEDEPQRKLDADEDKSNPQYVPRNGIYYQHDNRIKRNRNVNKTPNEPTNPAWKKKYKSKGHRQNRQNKNFYPQSPGQVRPDTVPPRMRQQQQQQSQQESPRQQQHDAAANTRKHYARRRQRRPVAERPGQQGYQPQHGQHGYYPQGYPPGHFSNFSSPLFWVPPPQFWPTPSIINYIQVSSGPASQPNFPGFQGFGPRV